MKRWERTVKESKINLWVVTTASEKLLCIKIGSEFFIKNLLRTALEPHYIVKSEKI